MASTSCYFCTNVFSSSHDFVEHFQSHFTAGHCSDCKQQLISINGVVYFLQLHLPSSCSWDINSKANRTNEKEFLCEKRVNKRQSANNIDQIKRRPTKRKNRKKSACESMNKGSASSALVICKNEQEVNDSMLTGGDEDEMDIKIEIDGITYSYDLEISSDLDIQKPQLDETTEHLVKCSDVTDADLSKLPAYLVAGKSTGEKRLRQYQCDICHRFLLTKRTLQAHMTNKHTDEAIKNNVCDICGINCASSSNLKKHKLTHEDCRFICNFCGKGFHGKHNMNEHMNMHTGNAPSLDCCSSKSVQI